ncbi:Gfo/Idh/MocA family protein [Natronorubrum texcoconense]|uniref:Predicted dehydrogenase n=1 Tax=Natronorubrum texcoconense TaxID=1095776 RepID=A0A1G9CR22_9EURY|nr:Gfo/Idh/MocA family oxidoreductase [Natronorubrum texcoconense]SDK54058.1 Predicted dehydrogenase [Natronorubrum texcoconense]
MAYTVAVIGTGAEPDDPGRDGYAMAYHHAAGYENTENCDLVACVDIVRANAEAFADEFEIGQDGIFEEYAAMLEAVEPDVVSVCVPPSIHERIVVDCIRSGVVEAIHCEKPMADTYGGARLMVQEADRHDVQLTFNHQRRFSDAVRTAKELLDGGEIGELERVEFAAPVGIFDYGSHSFDLCNYFVDETAGEWVLAQIDYSEENLLFGAHNENQAIVHWEYENGVHGLGTSDSDGVGSRGPTGAVGCHNRLVGTRGVIEVGPAAGGSDDGGDGGGDRELPPLRIRRAGDETWTAVETDDGLHSWAFVDRAIADLVRCLETDDEPELCARNALNATELIFAAWESSRRRGRVDLPLEIGDNPLEAMVETGEVTPGPTTGTNEE